MAEEAAPRDNSRGSQTVGAGLSIVSTVAPALGIPIPHPVLWVAFFVGVLMMIWPRILAAARHIRRMKLDTSTFVIIGLSIVLVGAAIALGALISQKYQKPETASASPVPKTVPEHSPAQRKFYSTADKERIAEALYKITSIVDGPIMQVHGKIYQMMMMWDHEKIVISQSKKPHIEPIQTLGQEIERLMLQFNVAFYDDENGLLKTYNRYSDDLNPVLQQTKDRPASAPLLQTMRAFLVGCDTAKIAAGKDDLELVRKIFEMNQIAYEQLNQARNDYYGWVTRVQHEVQQKTLELSR